MCDGQLTPSWARQERLLAARVERRGHAVEVLGVCIKAVLPLAIVVIASKPRRPELRLQATQASSRSEQAVRYTGSSCYLLLLLLLLLLAVAAAS